MRLRFAVFILTVISAPPEAQWNFPTPGIPRLPNGEANPAAPAPRTTDGKPDLSGVWRVDSARCNPNGEGNCSEFGNIGARLNTGLPYQPWAAELVKKRAEGIGKDDPVGFCQPGGALRLFTYPLYGKIMQDSGLVVIVWNAMSRFVRSAPMDDHFRRTQLRLGNREDIERCVFRA